MSATTSCVRCGRRGERGFWLGEVGGEYGYRCKDQSACQKRVDAPVVENAEYAAFMGRIARSMAQRAAGDIDFLPAIAQLRDTLDELLADSIDEGRRVEQWSWAEIGQRLGVGRSAAQERYGRRAVS